MSTSARRKGVLGALVANLFTAQHSFAARTLGLGTKLSSAFFFSEETNIVYRSFLGGAFRSLDWGFVFSVAETIINERSSSRKDTN